VRNNNNSNNNNISPPASIEPFKLEFIGCEHDEGLGALQCRYSSVSDAREESTTSQKPLLLLDFAGDSTTDEVFSHPLLAEAADSLFIAVRLPAEEPLIGKGSVRVVSSDGTDTLGQVPESLLSVASVSMLMVKGLTLAQTTIPVYLQLLSEEQNGRQQWQSNGRRIDRHALFGVSDSTEGEVEFGGLDGVLATRCGHVGRQPVVQLTYDSTRLSFCSLVRFAVQQNLADVVYYQSSDEKIAARMELQRVEATTSELVSFLGTTTIQPSVNAKIGLRQTMLRFVPMTDLQATRANRLAQRGAFNEATRLLSPRQGMILMRSMQAKGLIEAVDVPIKQAWKRLSEE